MPNETQWLTTADAAKRLNVSSRTVRRRCEAGTLAARFVAGVWEVSADAIGHADTDAAKVTDSRTRTDGHAAKQSDSDLNASADTRTQNADSRTSSDGHADTDTRTVGQPRGHSETGDLTARLIEQLERENKRLAEANEQHQRAEAELRAALREALRAMPKQLTAGNELVKVGDEIGGQTGQNGTGGAELQPIATQKENTVPTIATDGPQRAQSGAAGNVPNAAPDAVKSAPDARGRGLRLVRDGLKAMFGGKGI